MKDLQPETHYLFCAVARGINDLTTQIAIDTGVGSIGTAPIFKAVVDCLVEDLMRKYKTDAERRRFMLVCQAAQTIVKEIFDIRAGALVSELKKEEES